MMSVAWKSDRVRLRDLVPWRSNPRRISKRQARRLLDSWQRFGQVEVIAVGPNNEVYNGHQRLKVLSEVYGGDYEVEVRRASRALTDEERKALTIALHAGAVGEWDWDALQSWGAGNLKSWGLDEAVLEEWREQARALAEMLDIDRGVDLDKRPASASRSRALDVIYTLQGADCTCCLAVQAGMRYGIQSGSYRLCPYTYYLSGRHEVAFIDNDYFAYNHPRHMMAVRQLRPKYATVRDVISEDVCEAQGIAYYELPQILDWAAEISEYAENVIVIPKYDCIDKIPEKYILGYSVPSSHGGTPLPVEAFKGRRVHLLGGSWAAQLAYLAELGDDVVSLDTNYVARIADLGKAVMPDGDTFALREIGLGYLHNVRYAALAISFGAIMSEVRKICKEG